MPLSVDSALADTCNNPWGWPCKGLTGGRNLSVQLRENWPDDAQSAIASVWLLFYLLVIGSAVMSPPASHLAKSPWRRRIQFVCTQPHITRSRQMRTIGL